MRNLRPGGTPIWALIPSLLVGAGLGIGKVVRDCSLTCNVGFRYVPLALLAVALVTAPAAGLALRAQARLGPGRWDRRLALGTAAALLGFRLWTAWLHSLHATGLGTDGSLRFVIVAMRWSYLFFYVGIGVLFGLLAGAAFEVLLRAARNERGTGAEGRALLHGALAFTVGGLAGSLLARGLAAAWAGGGSYWATRDDLMLVMALVIAGAFSRTGPVATQGPAVTATPAAVPGVGAAFRALLAQPEGRLAALLVTVGGAADSVLKFIFYWAISEGTSAAGGRTALFADFYVFLGTGNLLMLAFGTSRVLRSLGLAVSLAALPSALLLGSAALAFQVSLAVVYALRLAESSLHVALNDPAIDRLMLTAEAETGESARATIKGAGPRFGEGLGAVVVLVADRGFGAGLDALLALLAGLAAIWLLGIVTHRRGLTADGFRRERSTSAPRPSAGSRLSTRV
ncbi:MAG: hypothetical protein NDJ94_11980 [Vicinamibacteria bacterium]|nr:hypothetical protein [Vicinamibacteria bacterium]